MRCSPSTLMSSMTKGSTAHARMAIVSPSSRAASLCIGEFMGALRCERWSEDELHDVIVERQHHYSHEQDDPHALCGDLGCLGQRTPPYRFCDMEKKMSAIEHRDRQQIEHAQADADQAEEGNEFDEA